MISLQHAHFRYLENWVVDDVSLRVPKGSLVTLVGPSGCGKSTLLRILSGLEPLEKGVLLIDGRPLEGVRKKTAVLFQDLGLFPWKTVVENITFVLIDRGMSSDKAYQKAMHHLDSVDMAEFSDRYPETLSGGQRQRVGFAKAIALDPDLLLLDEATASLDAFASESVQDILKHIHQTTDITMLVVTHKIDEAVFLGDQIAVMRQGKIKTVLDNPTVDDPNQRKSIEFFNVCNQVKEAFNHEKMD